MKVKRRKDRESGNKEAMKVIIEVKTKQKRH
jgi:hypothetical protein